LRSEDRDQLVEPGTTQGLFPRRRHPIAPRAGPPAGVAARDRGEVDPAVELLARDAAAFEPRPELLARDARERPVVERGAQAWGLADQQDPRHRPIGLRIAGDRDRFALV